MQVGTIALYNRILRQQQQQTIRETQEMIKRQNAINKNVSPVSFPVTAAQQAKQAKQAEKDRQKEIDNQCKITIARSKLAFIEDRIKTLRFQLDNAENKRDGTIPGGKEHKRYTREILSIEKQLQTLDENWTKAKTVIDKLT